MTYRQAMLLAAAAIGVAAVTSIVVGRARQPNRKPTTVASRQVAVADTASNRVAAHQANRPTDPTGRLPSVLIRDVPHERQKPDFCGEACAAMILRKLGRPLDQDYVFDCSGLDPLEGRGCYTGELAAALKKIGFKVGPVWYKIKTAKSAEQLEAQWRALHADLVDGVASIVCMHFDERPGRTEHFRLVLGYDANSDKIIYHEPANADGAYRRMARPTFLKLWPLKYATDTWTLVRIPLRPGRMGATGVSPVPGGRKATDSLTAADFAQHMMKLKKKVPREGFTVVIQPPFVVIGDESPETVRRRAERTVKWAVDLLKKSYFKKDPTEILDIWLFKDKASYEKHAKAIFRTKPTTPFGYYSHADRALVMNIRTGGGTLVHEIVHPFVASNFPECPAWFNEGLGSLYEQCREEDGRICGLTNWRLAGLQEAIRKGRVPSFKTLSSTSTHQFYNEDPGTNYAQARYLCYYLQQKGLLERYYHRFHQQHNTDPTGYKTLGEVLGREDMDAFKKDWEAYVLKLRFP